MSLPHAAPGDVIDLRPLGERLAEAVPVALFRTEQLEAMRLVLPAGKEISEHQVAGDFTLQCLEGRAEIRAHGRDIVLNQGEMVFIAANTRYAIRGVENASLLMTLARGREAEANG